MASSIRCGVRRSDNQPNECECTEIQLIFWARETHNAHAHTVNHTRKSSVNIHSGKMVSARIDLRFCVIYACPINADTVEKI